MEKEVTKVTTQIKKETDNPLEGMSFKYPPVSKEHFIALYEDYAKRCSD